MTGQSTNSTIARNTIFLYFRMMFTMIVSLYTSRVILQTLGINDFGIYQTVAGVVTMLSFMNNALSTGTSRFLTFELGTGDNEKLRRTFSSVLSVHICLALIIGLLAETIGLWFVYNKLIIPPDRLDAAVFAYHISILTCVITITQVPYNASIISHEKMNIYAYMSIVEVSLKLTIVYLLLITSSDKLKLYALLLCFIQVGIALFYRYYCIKHYNETKYIFIWDKEIVKRVLGYSGWNLFSNASQALNNQGATILINMFFTPSVVAARAIANQVNMAANQFISNFRTAANPQIVKRYAMEDYEGSKRLLLSSTKFSYYLMLVLSLPVCLVAEPLLNLWLGVVPDYAVIFLKLTIVTSLFQVFDTSFYTALYAKGKIRQNAMMSLSLGFCIFLIVYVMFKFGFSPVSLAWALLFLYAILGLVVKPVLIIKIVDYTWKDIFSVFIPCLKVTTIATPIPILLYFLKDYYVSNIYIQFVVLVFVSVICVILAVWIFGISKSMRIKVSGMIRKKYFLKL